MEEIVKACSPGIRPRIAMGVEPISIPLRKTTARSSEALRMMEPGLVGAFSGCQVVENALSNDEDELPLHSSTSGAGAKRGISADAVMITVIPSWVTEVRCSPRATGRQMQPCDAGAPVRLPA